MQISYLSYPITKSMPVYGGCVEPELTPINVIDKGDSCNTWRFCLENHWGTHVDGPNHFFTNGQKIIDYPADFWRFKKPQIVQIETKPGQIITRNMLSCKLDPQTDLILFQSGWWKFREDEKYSTQNPGLHPELALWLRQDFPAVRAIGMDWISVSSYENRELGREAHRTFLNPEGEGYPILIIEDMNLSKNLKNLAEVLVVPILIEKIDSAPCTIIGFFEE